MSFSKMIVGVVAVMALVGATTVFAWGPGGGFGGCGMGGCGFGQGACPAIEKLGLTAEQKDQINALRTEFLKKQEALRSEKAQKRIEMLELASKKPLDESALQKKREEMWAIQDKMRTEGRAMGTKFRSLLTPEQKEKMGPGGFGFGGCGKRGFGGPNAGRGAGLGKVALNSF
ncbi:MAG: Spy/CpxP family protein refolding chaperone [Desulfomonilaceae bacterium]